jgi:hypothetical protein
MSFGTCMFYKHKDGNTPKCAFQKAYLSKTTSKAQPNSNFGPEYQRGSPLGLASRPPEQDGGDRLATPSAGALSQNRPIYKSTSTMATIEVATLSYLSPYKPGNLSSITMDLESSPTYNQDCTWFNIHVTCYNKFTNSSHTSEFNIVITTQVQM